MEIGTFFRTGSFYWSGLSVPIGVFVAVRPEGGLCGFLEASLRPFADGCATSPVGYIEGWFVDDDARRHGIGRGLVMAAEEWARSRGCTEMASDARSHNTVSLNAHKAIGYQAVGQSVNFRKQLAGTASKNETLVGSISLIVLKDTFAVCRLGPDASVPSWAADGEFVSVTRSAEEVSIVCCQNAVPSEIRCERDWRCLRVAGSLPFSMIGVLAGLSATLARAGISVLAISTFDTDYLLVKGADVAPAVNAFEARGYRVVSL
jgi:GNAT superfamily N-acetyltransferase